MMSKITLVDEGVFPITKLADGSATHEAPKTGWDFAGTVQGEGKLAGVPSLFVRFASCNLRCMWQLPNGEICCCDTTYASFYPENSQSWPVQQIVDTIKCNLGLMKHVVITGGEPLLQKDALAQLCIELKKQCKVHITIETNGTIFDQSVAENIDLISISPKLRNSEPNNQKLSQLKIQPAGPFVYHAETRLQIDVLQQWITQSKVLGFDFQLKFVIAQSDEANEINHDFLSKIDGWQGSDILLMPLGTNHTELDQTTPIALQMAVINGWRFTPRVHIDIFGCKKGV
jgi:7-carboxy-7-deazaguanine synthase